MNDPTHKQEDIDQYRLLIEGTPLGIVVHVRGVLRFANQAAHDILGSQADLLGTKLDDWIYPDDLAGTIERLRAAQDEIQHRSTEVRVVRGDGTVAQLEVMGTVTTWHGEPGAQVVFTDITDRKLAMLTATRKQEQALHAQKLESIGRIAGGVAHDFNNILTGILGYAELIEMTHTDPGLLADLAEIRKAAERGASLTRQLLAYSRKQHIVPRVLSPQAAILDLEGLLNRVVGKKSTIELDLDADASSVYVDPGQLDQVVINLVVNAGESMPKGGKVKIRLQNVALATGEFVRLDVRDEGGGFSGEARHRAFEPFFSTKENGTGLGLSTVFGVAQQNGGYAEVHSIQPGAMVSFFLPKDGRTEMGTRTPA